MHGGYRAGGVELFRGEDNNTDAAHIAMATAASCMLASRSRCSGREESPARQLGSHSTFDGVGLVAVVWWKVTNRQVFHPCATSDGTWVSHTGPVFASAEYARCSRHCSPGWQRSPRWRGTQSAGRDEPGLCVGEEKDLPTAWRRTSRCCWRCACEHLVETSERLSEAHLSRLWPKRLWLATRHQCPSTARVPRCWMY